MSELIIRSNDANSVLVAELGGYAVAEFFYQRGKNNFPHYDAYKLAKDFIDSQKVPIPMTEAEYKDYLSEQDRIKRQEEEQR